MIFGIKKCFMCLIKKPQNKSVFFGRVSENAKCCLRQNILCRPQIFGRNLNSYFSKKDR